VSAGLFGHLSEHEFPMVGVCSGVRTLLRTPMGIQMLPLGRPDGSKGVDFVEL
jgi:hypothetical protein